MTFVTSNTEEIHTGQLVQNGRYEKEGSDSDDDGGDGVTGEAHVDSV